MTCLCHFMPGKAAQFIKCETSLPVLPRSASNSLLFLVVGLIFAGSLKISSAVLPPNVKTMFSPLASAWRLFLERNGGRVICTMLSSVPVLRLFAASTAWTGGYFQGSYVSNCYLFNCLATTS